MTSAFLDDSTATQLDALALDCFHGRAVEMVSLSGVDRLRGMCPRRKGSIPFIFADTKIHGASERMVIVEL